MPPFQLVMYQFFVQAIALFAYDFILSIIFFISVNGDNRQKLYTFEYNYKSLF